MSVAAYVARPLSFLSEARNILVLAGPLFLGQLAYKSQLVTNMVLLGQLGAEAAAAGTLVMSFLLPVLLTSDGIISVVAPFVAQDLGRHSADGGRTYFQQGLWTALLAAAIFTPFLLNLRYPLSLLGQDPELAKVAQDYASAICLMVFPSICLVVFRNALAAHRIAYPVLLIVVTGTVLNYGLGQLLVANEAILPFTGIQGIGYVTAGSSLFMLATVALYTKLNWRVKKLHYYKDFWKPDFGAMGRILRLGVPIGLTSFTASMIFSGVAFVIGNINADDLAGHGVAQQYFSLGFTIPTVIGISASIRIGLAFGQRDIDALKAVATTAVILVVVAMLLLTLLIFAASEPMVAVFLSPDLSNSAAAFSSGVLFTKYVGILLFAASIQCIFLFFFRAVADTFVPFLLSIFGYIVVGYAGLAIFPYVVGMGSVGAYYALILSEVVVSAVFIGRFQLRLMVLTRLWPQKNMPKPAIESESGNV